jgi:hypothetical protein
MIYKKLTDFSGEIAGEFEADRYGTVTNGQVDLGAVVRDASGSEYRWYPAGAPDPAPILEAANLTWDQFLDVSMATNSVKTNAILINMPVVAEYGRKYTIIPGIEYADATNPSARLFRLMQAAKTAGLIDQTFIDDFLLNWKAIFPA